jgi:hypothetical protein
MAFRRSRALPSTVAEAARGAAIVKHGGTMPARSLVAAAAQVKLDAASVQSLKIAEADWQKEAWRLYDIVGEFRFVANRRGHQLARIRTYVAEVDDTGAPGKETSDKEIKALAEGIFGGPAAKAEGMRTVGIQLFVAGECYIVAESATKAGDDGPEGDKWYVVSPTDLKKESGTIKVKKPESAGGGWYDLKASSDLLIRVWTPHPRKFDMADSPTRAVLPVLREIERLSMLAFSQIDSRLISAGLLLFKKGLDFPARGEDGKPGLDGLMDAIIEAARLSLQGSGTAAALVPIAAEIGGEGSVQDAVHHLRFDTPLTGELKEKLDHAIRRLALGLDAPPEVLMGQGDANHWSAWQISEDEIKTQVEPVAIRICDALTTAYLAPALQAIGKPEDDVDGWTLWFDTAPLAVRPNRFEDALKAWEKGLISNEALLNAGAFDADDEATKKALLEWRAWELIKLNPQLVGDPEIQKILGLPAITVPASPGQDPNAMPPEDPAALDPAEEQNALPAEPTSTETPAQAEGEESFAAMLPAAEQVVLRALELAGGRLLDRRNRGQFGSIPKHDLHTRVQARDRAHAGELLAGAFTHVPTLAAHHGVPPGDLEWLLRGYCTELLLQGYPHGAPLLRETLRRASHGR